MPFIHPKGMVIWNELMKFWFEVHHADNYLEIKTPVMMSRELWETSGHWDYYRENMYTSEIEEKVFAIKPMNCPCHVQIFNQGVKSYRDLPLRMAEFGNHTHAGQHDHSAAKTQCSLTKSTRGQPA